MNGSCERQGFVDCFNPSHEFLVLGIVLVVLFVRRNAKATLPVEIRVQSDKNSSTIAVGVMQSSSTNPATMYVNARASRFGLHRRSRVLLEWNMPPLRNL